MGRSRLQVAFYRFRVTFALHRAGYVGIVVLVGLLGGLALGAVAGARRTQSSFPSYLAASNSSDLGVVSGVLNPLLGSNKGFDPARVQRIASLPDVRSARSEVGLDVLPLHADGTPLEVAGLQPSAGNGLGSVDGAELVQDRVTVVQGRLPDPTRAGEIVMTADVARMVRARVGQRYSMGVYTNAQTMLPGFGTKAVKPYRRVDVTLVGVVVEPRNVVQDDVDRGSQSLALFTPAFTRPFLSCCSNYSVTYVQVRGGSRTVPAVDAEISRVLPNGFPPPNDVADVIAKAERAIKPQAIALGVFGGIAGLAVLLVAAQLIGRQLRVAAGEMAVLRAVGADRSTTFLSGLLGILAALVLGTAVAIGVAVGLSPLAPLGPVHAVDPAAGVSLDSTVLGLGAGALLVAITAIAMLLAWRLAPHRVPHRRAVSGPTSAVARAASSGLPAPAVTGIRFALEPGGGREAVPVRSAILGAGLAVVAVVGTLVFGSSLRSLVSHPRLYGWNWDYILVAGGTSGNAPERPATALLNGDGYVRAWSGAYFDDVRIAGHVVPVIGERAGTAIQPPILSGHGMEGPDQVVLGAVTLGQLHEQLGDTVTVDTGSGAPHRLQIVGTAAMPTIGGPGPHLEMGTGAILSYDLIPPAARNPFNDPTPGPEAIFVDVRPGVDHAAATRSLQRIADALSNNFNFGVALGPVLRPAEIVNYRSLGTTPAVLGGALALGAAVALTLTLVASVRRRRRDLAVLRTLGFTARQLAATVAWQSSVAVVIGTVVGVPLGIAVGRELWNVFADGIHAVPSPTVPVSWVALVAAGALVLANRVAALPGRVAARIPAVHALRAE